MSGAELRRECGGDEKSREDFARSKQSEAVLYKWDKAADQNWRIAKGNQVLNIRAVSGLYGS